MASLRLRIEHLGCKECQLASNSLCALPLRKPLPAESLAKSAGAPKASAPTFGVSVVGDALIWMERHCQQTYRGLFQGRAPLASGNRPRILGAWEIWLVAPGIVMEAGPVVWMF